MIARYERFKAVRKAVNREMRRRTYDRHAYDDKVFREGVYDIAAAALGESDALLRTPAAVKRVARVLAVAGGWCAADWDKLPNGSVISDHYSSVATAAITALLGEPA